MDETSYQGMPDGTGTDWQDEAQPDSGQYGQYPQMGDSQVQYPQPQYPQVGYGQQPYSQPQYPSQYPSYPQQGYGYNPQQAPSGYQPPASPRRFPRALAIAIAVLALGAAAAGGFIFLNSHDGGEPTITGTATKGSRGSESEEVWKRIEEKSLTTEDADALRMMEKMLGKVYDDTADGDYRKYPSSYVTDTIDEMEWPGEDVGWGSPSTSGTNPQLWARMAVLSEEWLHGQLGGNWVPVDFSYPVGEEIERGVVRTRLIGQSDDVLGMDVTVSYHRWEAEPRFECEDGALENAKESHKRIAKAEPAIAKLSDDWQHDVILSGGSVPTVAINEIYKDGTLGHEDGDHERELGTKESLTPIVEEVGKAMGDAGYNSARVLVMPWLTQYGKPEISLTSPLKWKYSAHDEFPKYTDEEYRARMLSGAFGYTPEWDSTQASGKWEKGGKVSVEAVDLSGDRVIGDPTPDPTEAFTESEMTIAGLPEQVGNSVSGPLYSYYIAPHNENLTKALRILYAPEGVQPDGLLNKGITAMLMKRNGGTNPAEGDNRHEVTMSDGTPVTVASYHFEDDMEDWEREAAWTKEATWWRQDESGETWGYRLTLYVDLDDSEIVRLIESIR